MTDELVKRLRDHADAAEAITDAPHGTTLSGWRQFARDQREAADRITALSEENERLKEEAAVWPEWATAIYGLLKSRGLYDSPADDVQLDEDVREYLEETERLLTTAEQSLAAAQQKLREAAEMLGDALSGFVGGTGDDKRWNIKRNKLVAEIRTNLAKETPNG